MSVERAHDAMVETGIEFAVALPDSFLAPLCHRLKRSKTVEYIQCTHESDCIGIAAGLTATGTRTLVLMENSGVRNACETLARLNLSHRLFVSLLLSHRGAFGERNWWGLAHHDTMSPLLEMLRIRWSLIADMDEFQERLLMAFATASAGQCSVALVAAPAFLKQIQS